MAENAYTYEQLEMVQGWLQNQREKVVQELNSEYSDDTYALFQAAQNALLGNLDALIRTANRQKREAMQAVIAAGKE